MKEILIRKMLDSDLPEVMRLERELFTDPWQEEMFRQELEAESAYLLETSEEKKLIGYVCALQILDEFMITNIAVRNEEQQKGYGKKLLLYLTGEMVKQGCKRCFLEVRAKNFHAIEFYKRQGFETIGRRKNYYREPVDDALVMKLELY
jgi:ribosomal-protein-alanine N-acetyltransferase